MEIESLHQQMQQCIFLETKRHTPSRSTERPSPRRPLPRTQRRRYHLQPWRTLRPPRRSPFSPANS
jgi:hypothetical protein